MNIIIADDEHIVLKWLQKSISSLSQEYRVIGACLNGKQALELCMNNPVDVLITDIRMPLMYGTELIQRLRDAGRLPYAIILSAYDDFSYVRDAFTIGAKDYLLKPEITDGELKRCLENAYSAVRDKRAEREAEEVAPLQRLVFEYMEEKRGEDYGKLASLLLNHTGISEGRIMLLKLFCPDDKDFSKILQIARFLFSEHSLPHLPLYSPKTGHIILSQAADSEPAELVRELSQAFCSFGCGEIRMGVSDCLTLRDLPELYGQAAECLEYALYYSGDAYCLNRELQKKAADSAAVPAGRTDEIMDFIDKERYDGAAELIRGTLAELSESKPLPSAVRAFALETLMKLYWEKLGEPYRRGLSVSDLIAVSASESFSELTRRLENGTAEILDLIRREHGHSCYSEPTRGALAYIKQHYRETVSLDEIALHVHMSRSYLSRLFKKETGVNLFDFLLRYRLDAARALLQDRSLSIQRICAETGFQEQAYFSKVFKKRFGSSPGEFRRNEQYSTKEDK